MEAIRALRDLITWGRDQPSVPSRRGEEVSPFLTLHREMNRLFDDVFNSFGNTPSLLFDDVGHGVDVLKGVQRTPSIASDVVAGRTATVLRRAGLMARDAGRIGLTRGRREPVLEPDLVAPGDVQVVLVGEPGARAEAQA